MHQDKYILQLKRNISNSFRLHHHHHHHHHHHSNSNTFKPKTKTGNQYSNFLLILANINSLLNRHKGIPYKVSFRKQHRPAFDLVSHFNNE